MRRWFVAGLVAAFLAQTGIVAAMVWSRVSVLRTGQEIAIRSTFVDPRDIFRGHYVQLNLVAPVPEDATFSPDFQPDESGEVYAVFREAEDGFWIPDTLFSTHPGEQAGAVLTGDYVSGQSGQRRIILPHDRYFADYERAQELENLRAEQKLGVVLALDGKGGSVIKGLTIDGERVYDEPLL